MVWTPHLTDIVSYSYSVNQKGAHTMNKPSTICIDLAKNVEIKDSHIFTL